jgi:hypothetical protein
MSAFYAIFFVKPRSKGRGAWSISTLSVEGGRLGLREKPDT